MANFPAIKESDYLFRGVYCVYAVPLPDRPSWLISLFLPSPTTCSEKNGLFEADISSSPNPWERDAVVFIGLSIRLPGEKKGSSAIQTWKTNVYMYINV